MIHQGAHQQQQHLHMQYSQQASYLCLCRWTHAAPGHCLEVLVCPLLRMWSPPQLLQIMVLKHATDAQGTSTSRIFTFPHDSTGTAASTDDCHGSSTADKRTSPETAQMTPYSSAGVWGVHLASGTALRICRSPGRLWGAPLRDASHAAGLSSSLCESPAAPQTPHQRCI